MRQENRSILTRRGLLNLAATTCAVHAFNLHGSSAPEILPQVISGSDLLSQESAEGYRYRLHYLLSECETPLVSVAGATDLSQAKWLRLREAALKGAWLILESPAYFTGEEEERNYRTALRTAFDLSLNSRKVQTSSLYVRYVWPHPALLRTFGNAMAVECAPTEVVAQIDGFPVAAKRKLGSGGLIYLGSMLGPSLRSGDRDAVHLLDAIVAEIRSSRTLSGDTSRGA